MAAARPMAVIWPKNGILAYGGYTDLGRPTYCELWNTASGPGYGFLISWLGAGLRRACSFLYKVTYVQCTAPGREDCVSVYLCVVSTGNFHHKFTRLIRRP